MDTHEGPQGIFDRLGAIIANTHVVDTSGNHTDTYINKDAVFAHPTKTSLLCRFLAKHYATDEIEVVIGAAVGGAIVAQWTAYHLASMTGRDVLAVYADKVSVGGRDTFVVRRGYEKTIRGKRLLVGEDIVNSGETTRRIIDIAESAGGVIVAAGALWNRGGITLVPKLLALVTRAFKTWSEEECARSGPCSQGIPINTSIGHGREFLTRKQFA
jgi:orotate phosphoribosyltransferase